MTIPFMQYMRPDGRRVPRYIQRGDQAEAQAKQVIADGYRFEIEVLTNGLVSMTSHYKDEDGTVAIQIGENNEKIPALVDSLIRLTFEDWRERTAPCTTAST